MTEFTLTPVVPSSSSATAAERLVLGETRSARSGLPLAAMHTPREDTAVYGVRTIDTNGRVIDKAVMTALGWQIGDHLHWRVRHGLVIISRPGYGALGITAHGHLRLPVAVRRAARLEVRDQVLLAADTSHGLLVVYPPRAIDEMVARRFAEGLDGDAS